MITFSPDKFGFYCVGDKTTYSKYEVIEWSKSLNIPFYWNFNREVYGAIDWKTEPDKPLWEMYKERARQIRDAYDYVVLWYSGGSDSHNMICAWIEAGCKIDEIATTWNYEATGDYQNHYNAEITNVVLPDIKKLQEKFDFKFRIVDISQFCIDIFDRWKTEFEYNVNCHMSPNNPARNLFREKIDDYKNIIDQGKKLCFVWGKEKPMMRYSPKAKDMYVEFYDNIDNCVGPYVQRNYHKGWYDELFYWTPDYPLIPVKQAHTISKFIKLCDDRSLFTNKKNFNGYSIKFDAFLRNEPLKTIIYPKWSNDIFCNGKTSSFTYSIRDSWLLKGNHDYRDKFFDITHSVYNAIDPYNNTREKLWPMASRKYLIA